MLCPVCNTQPAPGQRFCGECGSPLPQARLGTAPLPQDERRQVTILFADIAGFTSLAESLDPEQVTAIINDCFASLSETVTAYDGTVDKYIGDEIMVIFGAPTAHEDDPARAVRCALDMIERITRFNQERSHLLPQPLSLHVGINSGLVVAGPMSSGGNYTVIGEAVNTASRLEELSGYNEVLIGETTQAAVADLFNCERVDTIQMRGGVSNLTVYRVLKLREDVTGQHAALREELVAPMIGRADEMAALRQLAGGLVQQGACAFIFGESGSGKSRLVAELRPHFRDYGWVEGAGQPLGQQLAYYIWRTVVRRLGSVELTDTEVAQQQLHSWLAGLSLPDPDTIYRGLARVLGIDSDGTADDALAAASVTALLRGLAARQPTVVILDDLHHADPAALDLLAMLVAAPPLPGLLLLILCRDDGSAGEMAVRRDVTLAEGSYRGRSRVLALPPLTVAEGRALVAALLEVDDLPQPIVEAILERTGGNPFYTEEVIRSLIESGQLHRLVYREGHSFRLRPDHANETLEVPASLEGVVGARLDRLPPAARQVLQVAAVLNRRFDLPVLQQLLTGTPVSDLPTVLRELERAELLVRSRDQYSFRQQLIQEVAYNRLLLNTRRQHHATAAAFYASLPLPSPLRAVGDLRTLLDAFYHYMQAQDYAAAFALTDRPLPSPLGTLDETLERWGGNLTRRNLYRQLAPHLAGVERIAVLIRLGRASYNLGELSEAATAYREAEQLAAAAGDLSQQAFIIGLLGIAYQGMGDFQAALDCYDQALPVAVLLGDRTLEGRWLNNLGAIHANQGHFTEAEPYFQRALAIAREVGDRRAEGLRLGNLSLCCREGNPQQAVTYASEALAIMRELGDQRQIALWLTNLGETYSEVSAVEQQLACLHEAIEIGRGIGDQQAESRCLIGLGTAYSGQGQLAEAATYLYQSLDIARRIGDHAGESSIHAHLANIHQAGGDLPATVQELEAAVAVAERSGEPQYKSVALAGLGLVYLKLGRGDEAQAKLTQARSDAEAHGRAAIIWLARSSQARYYAAERQPAEAEQLLATISGDLPGLLDERAEIAYNLACTHALLGRCAEAVAYVQTAVQLVPRHRLLLEREDDLTGCPSAVQAALQA